LPVNQKICVGNKSPQDLRIMSHCEKNCGVKE
jgi:hypothetical protein